MIKIRDLHIRNYKMRSNPRAAIAYIAIKLISPNSKKSIFDYSRSKHIIFSGNIVPNKVTIYDHDSGCHITGNGNKNKFNLYHLGDSHHIRLTVEGEKIEGYDYGSSSHFIGAIKGESISIYDDGESSQFDYSLDNCTLSPKNIALKPAHIIAPVDNYTLPRESISLKSARILAQGDAKKELTSIYDDAKRLQFGYSL